MSEHKNHPFHLVEPSPWPIATSMSLLVLAVGAVLSMHKIDHIVLIIGVCLLLYTVFGWWRDVVKEANTPNLHSHVVQNGLKIGMALFICSEIMLFGAFFWGYFNSAINPIEAIGATWPPKGITPFDPMHLPYLNTLILLLSGSTLTWAHQELVNGKLSQTTKFLTITVSLGIAFTVIQAFEYAHAAFAFKDGIYASIFYMATGFHGAHVIIGTIFLAVCLFRNIKGEFQPNHHVGFEAAAWYWHFVDVVWLFLFITIYWGSYKTFIQ